MAAIVHLPHHNPYHGAPMKYLLMIYANEALETAMPPAKIGALK